MGHVVKGVHHTIDVENEELLNSEHPPTAIRINKYNTGANIVSYIQSHPAGSYKTGIGYNLELEHTAVS